jgi:hypothetical protein
VSPSKKQLNARAGADSLHRSLVTLMLCLLQSALNPNDVYYGSTLKRLLAAKPNEFLLNYKVAAISKARLQQPLLNLN